MKKVHFFWITVVNIKLVSAFSKWFEVGPGSTVTTTTIAGADSQYVVIGQKYDWRVYTIDWGTQTPTLVGSNPITLPADPKLGWNCRVQGDSQTNNVVVTSAVAWRFSIQLGGPTNFEKYLVPSGFYWLPKSIRSTIYLLVGSGSGVGRLFRVQSDTTADMKEFTVSSATNAYGPVYGATLAIFSTRNSNLRYVYDYTIGHKEGTDSWAAVHTKVGHKNEMGFMSPLDGRDRYVVCKKSNTPAVSFHSVKVSDGVEQFNRDLTPIGINRDIRTMVWIPDTDLSFLAAQRWRVALVDLMDDTKPIIFVNTYLQNKIYNSDVWVDRRALIFGATVPEEKSMVYKLSETEQPCGALCSSCDSFWRLKCLGCKPNSSPSAGDSCSCNSNF